MKLITPNCRAQFAAQDIDFIVSVLGRRLGSAECLVQLLADEESRDQILDDEELHRALLERGGCLKVSTRLYFYVIVRQAFRRARIEDRAVADYVAEVLTEFSRTERGSCAVPGESQLLDYLFEMVTALNRVDERTRFFIGLHIGDYSLFLSGVFPDRIRSRAESRGFPGIGYYEGLGRAHYGIASNHRLAQKYALTSVLATLAERFDTTRLALNDVAERLFCFEETNALEQLLRERRVGGKS
jgi:hypothetical protein